MLKNEPEVMTVIEVAKVLRLGKNKTYDLINIEPLVKEFILYQM